jgi:hypothetical protein
MVPQRLRAVLRPLWHLLFNPDADPPRVIIAAAVTFAVAVLTPLLWVVLQALQIDPATGLAVVTAPTTVRSRPTVCCWSPRSRSSGSPSPSHWRS